MMKPQPKWLLPPSTQSGFTIIESLLAILIVTILLVGIAPVITLSVANRLQARRVEQATQAARTYIDGVRSQKITPPAHIRVLNQGDSVTGEKYFGVQRTIFSNTDPPDSASANVNTCSAATYCQDQVDLSLYCADFDGSGACETSSVTDLIIQSFRSSFDVTDPDDVKKGFLLGVRVYQASAFDNVRELQTTKERLTAGEKKAATNTAGTSDKRAPLVEMTTEVRGTSDTPYNGLCDRLGGCQQ